MSATTSDSDSILTADTTTLKLSTNVINNNSSNSKTPLISPIHGVSNELLNNAAQKDPKTGIKNIPFKAPQAISINNMSYNPITQMWEGNEDDEEILEFDEIINENKGKKKKVKKEKVYDLSPFHLTASEELIIKRRARQHLVDLKYPKHGVEARLIANTVKSKRIAESTPTGPITVPRQYEARPDLFIIRDMAAQRVVLDNKKMEDMESKQ